MVTPPPTPRPDPARWLLTQRERGNPWTRVDGGHAGGAAWSEGNEVRPLVHGATYFAELCERIDATRPGPARLPRFQDFLYRDVRDLGASKREKRKSKFYE